MHDRKSISIIRIIRQGKLLKKILLWADANALSCINTAPVTLPYENMQLSTRNSIHTNTDLHLCHFISWKYTTAWHYALFCFVNWSSGNLSLFFFDKLKRIALIFRKNGTITLRLWKQSGVDVCCNLLFFPCPPVSAFQQGGAFRFSGSQQFITVLLTCMYIVHNQNIYAKLHSNVNIGGIGG